MTTHGLPKTAVDTDATLDIAIDPSQRNTPLMPASAPQRTTALLHGSLPPEAGARATLTVLTGLNAGRLVAVDGASVTIGRAAGAGLVVDEPGVSRRHARVAHTPSGGFYVEDLGSTNGTFVGSARIGVALLSDGDLLQLGPRLRLRFAFVDAVEERPHRQLHEPAVRGPFTHVFNRKRLADLLLAEVGRARRASSEVAVLMIDVDSPKEVDGSFSYISCNHTISTVAARLLHALRVEDVLARHGGDEFVVLAAGTDRTDAERLADRLRRAVSALEMAAGGPQVRITASIGVALLTELTASDEPVATLLAMAHARMYEAKVSGRNRVCALSEAPLVR